MREENRKLWTERIEDYRSSGLTAVKWAEDREVGVHKLRYYIHKFNKEKKENLNKKSKDMQWTSIALEESVIKDKSHKLLKIIIGKATIEVSPGFDIDTFELVAKVLSKC